jgi:hypothetical protein
MQASLLVYWKNTYTVHGKAFGEYVYALGGNPAMRTAVYIFSRVIEAFAPSSSSSSSSRSSDDDDGRNRIGAVFAELHARRLLSISWTDIPEWTD